MIEAVIFDMDGVLIDSEPANVDLISQFFQIHGKYASAQYLRSLVGRSAHDTWHLTKAAWQEDITYEEYHQQFQAFQANHPIDYPSILYPQVKEVLAWLKEQGYLVAVASSSRLVKIKEVLKKCDIETYFDAIISGEQCIHSKPDPEIYRKAAQLLHVPVERCLAIEDSNAGIASCKGANMKVVALVDPRYGADPSQADAQIDEMRELIDVLKHMRI